MYELFCADTPSGLIASASSCRANATQIFKELAHSIRRSPALANLARITESQKKIRVKQNNSEYVSISADASSAEGYNFSVVCEDELHSWQSPKLHRALEYSMISRPSGLLLQISTAGSDLSSFYFDIYSKAKRQLSGEDPPDIHAYQEIYEPTTENPDLDDPAQWKAANPSMGVSFSEDAFRADATASKGTSADRLSWMRYRANMWVSGSDETYLDLLRWDHCKKPAPEEIKTAPCWLGIDLSQSVDPSSISAVWSLGNRRFHVDSWAFCADEGIRKRESQNLPRFNSFVANKEMTITSGDMIDTNIIKVKILELCRTYNVVSVVFDSYSAFVLANEISQQGIEVFRCGMTYRYMDQPCKEFQIAVNEGRVSHSGNTWLRWSLGNVRTETNEYGQTRIHRERSADKIDGAVSTILSFSQALQASVLPNKPSVYETRGILTF